MYYLFIFQVLLIMFRWSNHLINIKCWLFYRLQYTSIKNSVSDLIRVSSEIAGYRYRSTWLDTSSNRQEIWYRQRLKFRNIGITDLYTSMEIYLFYKRNHKKCVKINNWAKHTAAPPGVLPGKPPDTISPPEKPGRPLVYPPGKLELPSPGYPPGTL